MARWARLSAAFAILLAAQGLLSSQGGLGGRPAEAAGKLEKIDNLKMTIANVNEYSETCGLTQDLMRDAFLQPLQGTGVRITASSAYFFYIKATTIPYIDDTCVTYVDVELLLTERYFNPVTGNEKAGLIRLWVRGGLYASGRPEHPAVVTKAFAELSRRFVESWQRDQ